MANIKTSSKPPIQAERLLYEKVREDLKSHISKMNVGDRLSSERQLSDYFKVDRVTVRRAMLDLENEGFVVRHQGRGTFINRLIAQEKQRLTGSKVIGLILPDVETPQFAAIFKGIEEEATTHGYQIWVRNALFDAEREISILDTIAKDELAGIITCPVFSNALSADYAAHVNALLSRGRRVVLLDQYVPGCEAPVAMVDKHKVGYLATEHLIMTGHRRIAYVSTHTFDTSGNDSYRGYRQALDDYGVRFDERLEINIPVESSAGPASDAIRALLSADSTTCTAIATPQFAMAYGIYRVLLELNLVPGRDVALVGNNMAYNPEYAHITHTSQSFQEVGAAAMQIFCRDENDTSRLQKHILVPPKLVVGTT